TETCMNCHSQIWSDSPYLDPVRQSWQTGRPLEWTRVHDLPDYAYFNHSIHVAKGVGCNTCHGPIDEMPAIYQAASLQMEWCLECHREPERFLRPKDQVFNMKWRAENRTAAELKQGYALKSEHKIRSSEILVSCSTCHR
ncbi:MAG: cytochrome c3 family protein, partial [Acidobacteriota bacterium]|nr:cytochrome c3 family protein [Acidobacteriota bacterium]